jgi:amino acid transporter
LPNSDPTQVIGATHGLKRSLGVRHVVFFVVAAAAPLVSILGAAPMAIVSGNGAGMPSSFLLAGVLLLIFSVGYTAMIRHTSSGGGFYALISEGLGRELGYGSAIVALVSYTAIQSATYGLLGYFCVLIVNPLLPVPIPWYAYCAIAILVIHYLGTRSIELNGGLLGTLMILEAGILLLLALAILRSGGGPDGITLAPFAIHNMFSGSPALAIIFALLCFTGFEATAIYSTETRDPNRSIPRATYIAVVLIAVFYTFTGWSIVVAYGLKNVVTAATTSPGELFFSRSQLLLGGAATGAMRVLILSSVMSAALAFHNTITRYVYFLAHAGVAPKCFTETHPRFHSPIMASRAQTGSAALLTGLFAVAGLDPYVVQYGWMGALGTLGLVALQFLVSLAVVVFFGRTRFDTRPWQTIIAPGIAALGLGMCIWKISSNLALLSGSNDVVVTAFPGLILGCLTGGALYALFRRKNAGEDRAAADG